MARHAGFLLVVTDQWRRKNRILDRIAAAMDFTDAVDGFEYQAARETVALLSLGDQFLTHACSVARGGNAVTGKARLRFSNFVEFEPVPFGSVLDAVSARSRDLLSLALSGSGRSIPPRAWKDLWQAVKDARPNVVGALERLEQSGNSQEVYYEEAAQISRLEADATALSLEIFGIDYRLLLQGWRSNINAAAFLSGQQEVTLPEDVMIAQDSLVFGEWQQLERSAIGAVTFVRNGERLQVMNVNRTRIEQTLGVDLLYFHHRFGSYVFVQYKRMSDGLNGGRPFFRPGGKSYDAEMQRMRLADKATFSARLASACEGYRLWGHAFFLKLCSPSLRTTMPNQLVSGMYFPLDYWDLLVGSPMTLGPQGGVSVTHQNAQRWVNNSLFVDLVQSGWVGSQPAGSRMLKDICEQSLDAGHSVTIAISSPTRS